MTRTPLAVLGQLSHRSRRLLIAATAAASLLGATAVGYRLARAMGVPAAKPFYYSGTIEESGQLVDGMRDFTLRLWSDSMSTDGMFLKCTTIVTGAQVTRGRFRIPLDDTCTAPVHANPDLWVEVLVGNNALGRRKMGAVPYALEADTASIIGGRKIARITVCNSTAAPTGCPGCSHQWTAAECDNGLPLGKCLSLGSHMYQCGGSITWEVFGPGELGPNGGMSWYAFNGNATPCAGTTARAVYMCDQ
jgi:hypothetical protein